MAGQIVDASLVSAPRQRDIATEKATVKAGRVPCEWQDKPAKLRQKDRDARWTPVFGKARLREDGTRHTGIAIPVFGYKSPQMSTGTTASSGPGTSRTRAAMTAACRAGICSTLRTPPRRSGRTAPIARW